MTVRHRGRHVFDSLAGNDIEGVAQNVLGTQYYVSKNDGSDSNAGTSRDAPLLTIQAAITKANALIDWGATPMKRQVIWVEPQVYAENLTPAYYCDIVGMGIRGTDQMAEIHPSTGSVMTGTLLGLACYNLQFEVDEASAEIFDIGICNNSKFQSCTFALGANVAGVVAIDTDNCTHLIVDDCDFESGQLQDMAYAFYHRGGADKYAHNVRYTNNRIFAQTCGIYIDAQCTDTEALFQKNFIHVPGTGKGIDDNNGGSFCVENDIVIDGAGDAIEHAGGAGHTLRNHTLVNGVYALETA